MKNTYQTTIILMITLQFILPVVALAGPGGPPATPIDGGLSLLLALGGGYALKKLRQKT